MTKPFRYQREDVIRVEEEFNGRALVSWDTGLGKSFLSLWFAHRNPECFPAVVVCPASLKYQWEREAALHFGWRAEVLETTRPHRRGGFHRKRKLTIVNFEILGQRRSESCGPGWVKHLKAMEPKLIIIDECQKIVNRDTRQSRWVRDLCQGVPHVLALSATPLTNRHAELWNIVNLIKPDLFPTFSGFAREFCPGKRTPWGMDHRRSTHGPKLHKILTRECLVRRRKADVLADLPPKVRTILPLPITDRRQYDRAENDFRGWLRQYDAGKMSSALRAERLTQLARLKFLAAQLKLPAALSWVDQFLEDGDEKIILFCIHHKIVDAVHAKYSRKSVTVTGKVTGRKRQDAIDQFLTDDRTRILIGNIQAAGVGWSAKGVSTSAFLELPWKPADCTQAEDRCHGINRGTEGVHTQAVYLIARETVESRLAQILQSKQEILSTVLDGGEGEELAIFDDLCREIAMERNGR